MNSVVYRSSYFNFVKQMNSITVEFLNKSEIYL